MSGGTSYAAYAQAIKRREVGLDLPDRIVCAVCLESRLAVAFKPRWRQGHEKRGIAPSWMTLFWCATCQAKQASRSLDAEAMARWDAMQADVQAQIAAAKHDTALRAQLSRLGMPKARAQADALQQTPKTPPPTPYEQAVASLTMDLGRPETEWTRAEHLECTRRIYQVLGWDEATLYRGSQADRMAQAAKRGAAARRGMGTNENTTDEEGE